MNEWATSESRTAPRLRTLLKGKIIFNNRLSTVDCIVRDISAGGARLALAQHVTLPDVFELYVPLRERTYSAQVRWRAQEDLGVMFLDDHPDLRRLEETNDLRTRVDHLEAEVVALHGILERLTKQLPRGDAY